MTFIGRRPRLPWTLTQLDSRGLTVLFGLTLLTCIGGLYLADPGLYLTVVRVWVPESQPTPFVDATYIMGQLECWRHGVDVYLVNPCDINRGTMAYPPLWLRLWFLPSDTAAGAPFGLLLGVGFIISLAVLPRLTRAGDMLLLCAALASSATAYGVERGNTDLLIFILCAFVVVVVDRRFPARAAGYAVIVFAALLKLYPIILIAFFARERRRAGIALAVAAFTVVLLAIFAWHNEWREMFSNIPGPPYSSDGPGGRKLAEVVFVMADGLARLVWLAPGAWLDDVIPRRAATAAVFPVITLAAVFAAQCLSRDPGFGRVIGRLPPRENTCLAMGALLFCGCFLAGTSIAYREVLLLFAIPALLSFRHEPGLWPLVRWTAWMAILLMWASFPALMLDVTFGGLDLHGGPLPTFAFLLLREIAWWWLFVVLAAVLLCMGRRATDLTGEWRGGVPPPRSLTEPDVNLSAHPAPSI